MLVSVSLKKKQKNSPFRDVYLRNGHNDNLQRKNQNVSNVLLKTHQKEKNQRKEIPSNVA